MGIFSDIASKIAHVARSITGMGAANAATPGDATASQSGGSASSASSMASIDVEAVLKGLAAKAGVPSNYQTSIVDLLKLLNLDSSLEARCKLADELGYSGDKSDTASMNVWLIKQVYAKLAQNGGTIPAGWRH